MTSELRNFVDQLGSTATKLKDCGKEVVEVMEELDAPSLDRAALLVIDGKADVRLGVRNATEYAKRYHFLDRAKALVRVHFLSLEQYARNHAFPGYQDLATTIRTEAGNEDLRAALQNTRYRVISFNYDCCFELACGTVWPLKSGDDIVAPDLLNMAVAGNGADWNAERFTYLKAHGSIRTLATYDPVEREYQYGSHSVSAEHSSFTDEVFWNAAAKEPIHSSIFFPCERERLVGAERVIRPARWYTERLLPRLKATCADAATIRLIGYSASDQDIPYLRQIFSDARDCRRWEICGPEQSLPRIAARLVNLLDVPEEKIFCIPEQFGAAA